MDLKAILESILFASGEPLTTKKLGAIIGEEAKKIEEALFLLKDDYEKEKRGLGLINKDDEWLMVINPECSPFIQKFKKEVFEDDLSPKTLETLAIVAYRGPITRSEINEIRGVDSSYILRQLLLRELIERFFHPQKQNVFLYRISFKFLQHLGLSSVEQLFHYEQFKEPKI